MVRPERRDSSVAPSTERMVAAALASILMSLASARLSMKVESTAAPATSSR